jgi:hypothetical protein
VLPGGDRVHCGYIDAEAMLKRAASLGKTEYASYLRRIVAEHGNEPGSPDMQVNDLGLGGVLELIPKNWRSARLLLPKPIQRERFAAAGISMRLDAGQPVLLRRKGVLRGLHFQTAPAPRTSSSAC